jgi:hypothetical protein
LSRTRRAKVNRAGQHIHRQVIDDFGVVHGDLQQRRVQELLALIAQRFGNLRAHIWTIERQIFVLQLLALQLEDVPATAELHGRCVASVLHRVEEIGD